MASLQDRIVEGYETGRFDNTPQSFLPESRVAELITRISIVEELEYEDSDLENGEDNDLIDFIVKYAKKVFAIALIIDVSGTTLRVAMRNFKDYNFQDESLPLSKDALPGLPFFAKKPWTRLKTHNFLRDQWIFLAPVFSKTKFKLDLEPEHILPFTWVSNEAKDGTFSQVFQVKIHESHQEDLVLTVRVQFLHCTELLSLLHPVQTQF
jgi:hypothetical protein